MNASRPAKIQAVAFTARERTELVELPSDTAPLAEHELAGPTLASLTSPGTELNWGYWGNHFPQYPGYACVFRIAELGTSVTGLQVDDVVFAMGGHRSFQRHAAANVVKLPPGLTACDAVFARLMGVSMSTLVTTTARPPAPVLITGLGPVGNLAAQMFQSCGYHVVACDPIDSRRQLAVWSGLTDVRPRVNSDDPLAGKFQLHVECAGHEQAVLDGCQLLAKRGEVVLIGVPWKKRVDMQAFDLLHAVFHKYIVLRSGWEWELPIHPTEFRPGNLMDNFAGALRWLAQGKIKVDGLSLHAHPSDCAAIYRSLATQSLTKPCAVFAWAS